MTRLLAMLISLIPITCLVACDQQNTNKSQDLVGTWYGEQVLEGVTVRWLNRRQADGTFEAQFVACEQNVVRGTIKHFGAWVYEDGIYRTDVTRIENAQGEEKAKDPSKEYEQIYRAVGLSDSVFDYVHVDDNVEYSVERVDDSFEISCGD